MGQFFRPPGDDRIWYYSERGLLSFLLHDAREKGLSLILDHAVNHRGTRLREVVAPATPYRVLTEFGLGNRYGFGGPDGALLAGLGQTDASFVFVEGKPVRFRKSFWKPRSWVEIQATAAEADGRRRVRQMIRGYNQRLNGQLELRWRFINALRASGGSGKVSERHVTLPPDVIANDVLYWRHGYRPDPNRPEQWRRVNLREDLAGLHQALTAISRFYLLAITTDTQFPQQEMSQVRLFDSTGQPLPDAADRLFWLCLDRVKDELERWGDGGWRRPTPTG